MARSRRVHGRARGGSPSDEAPSWRCVCARVLHHERGHRAGRDDRQPTVDGHWRSPGTSPCGQDAEPGSGAIIGLDERQQGTWRCQAPSLPAEGIPNVPLSPAVSAPSFQRPSAYRRPRLWTRPLDARDGRRGHVCNCSRAEHTRERCRSDVPPGRKPGESVRDRERRCRDPDHEEGRTALPPRSSRSWPE
jgi:hypothetical protein